MPAKLIAATFAIACFIGTLAVGLAVNETLTRVMWEGIVVLIAAWCLGNLIGGLAQKTVDDQLADYRRQRPVPSEDPMAPGVERV